LVKVSLWKSFGPLKSASSRTPTLPRLVGVLVWRPKRLVRAVRYSCGFRRLPAGLSSAGTAGRIVAQSEFS
jgi:hypothetical protein